MGTLAVAPEISDETLIHDQVDRLDLPAGVKFARVERSQSWTGEPIWVIFFTVSKKIALTPKRIKELTAVKSGVNRSLLDAGITYFPLVTFLDGR